MNLPQSSSKPPDNVIIERKSYKPLTDSQLSTKQELLEFVQQQFKCIKEANEKTLLSIQEKNTEILEIEKQEHEMENKCGQIITDLQTELNNIQQVETYKNEIPILENNVKQLSRIYNNFKPNFNHYDKTLESYDDIVEIQVADFRDVASETKIVIDHVKNIGLAFSDLLQKYNTNKSIILLAKSKQEGMQTEFRTLEDNAIALHNKFKQEKCTAESKLNELLNEKTNTKKTYIASINNLKTTLKRLTIQNASLEEKLKQKVTECTQLSNLYNELSGNKMR